MPTGRGIKSDNLGFNKHIGRILKRQLLQVIPESLHDDLNPLFSDLRSKNLLRKMQAIAMIEYISNKLQVSFSLKEPIPDDIFEAEDEERSVEEIELVKHFKSRIKELGLPCFSDSSMCGFICESCCLLKILGLVICSSRGDNDE